MQPLHWSAHCQICLSGGQTLSAILNKRVRDLHCKRELLFSLRVFGAALKHARQALLWSPSIGDFIQVLASSLRHGCGHDGAGHLSPCYTWVWAFKPSILVGLGLA